MLTLVAEREFGSEVQNMYAPNSLSREQCQPVKQASVPQDSRLGQSGYVLIDPFLDDDGPRSVLDYEEKEQGPQDDLSSSSDVGTTRVISSPLARKHSHIQRVRFNETADEQENMSRSSAIPIPIVDTRTRCLTRNANGKGKKSPDLTSFSSVHSMRQRGDELDVLQELAMVSVHKRIDASDSDESSNYESSLDDELHSEMYLNAGEYELHDYPLPDISSGDEGDVEMEDDNNISQIELESHEANGNDIDDYYEVPSWVHKDSQLSAELPPYNSWQQEARDIWRPQRPRITNSALEVNDDIVSTPEIPRAMSRVPINEYTYRRRPLEDPSQAMALTKLSTEIAYNSQVSIELGDAQKLIWPSQEPSIPETLMDDKPIDAGGDTSQYTFVP